MADKIIIGQEEWCALSELGMPAIKAKFELGTERSYLQASNIRVCKEEEGKPCVRFEVYPIQNNVELVQECKAVLVSEEEATLDHKARVVVSTPVTLGEQTWDVELTLVHKDRAGYRLSLGKTALAGRTLIDPNARLCLGDKDKEEVKKNYRPFQGQRKGLNILVLTRQVGDYANTRLLEEGRKRGHNIRVINISECYMNVSKENPAVFYRGGLPLENIDAVIPHVETGITFYGCALTKQFQNLGAFCLNTSISIARARDKLRSQQLLSKSGLPMPNTGFANSPSNTMDIIKMVGGAPLVIKLVEGAQGEGVVLAETDNAAESVINTFKSLKANILVQEFIKEAEGTDIRCFVVGDEVVASMQRKAAPGDFRANLDLGGTASSIEITEEEREISIQAAKILELNVSGVDIIRSKTGPKVIEANSSPGLKGIEGATGVNIAEKMIECVERNVRR